MNVKEITPGQLNVEQFIATQVEELQKTVGDGLAVNALSGGVDSSGRNRDAIPNSLPR